METLERVEGIEPSSFAWRAAALPLSYTRAVLNRWPALISGFANTLGVEPNPGTDGLLAIPAMKSVPRISLRIHLTAAHYQPVPPMFEEVSRC